MDRQLLDASRGQGVAEVTGRSVKRWWAPAASAGRILSLSQPARSGPPRPIDVFGVGEIGRKLEAQAVVGVMHSQRFSQASLVLDVGRKATPVRPALHRSCSLPLPLNDSGSQSERQVSAGRRVVALRPNARY
jgi:hypothetical protein